MCLYRNLYKALSERVASFRRPIFGILGVKAKLWLLAQRPPRLKVKIMRAGVWFLCLLPASVSAHSDHCTFFCDYGLLDVDVQGAGTVRGLLLWAQLVLSPVCGLSRTQLPPLPLPSGLPQQILQVQFCGSFFLKNHI